MNLLCLDSFQLELHRNLQCFRLISPDSQAPFPSFPAHFDTGTQPADCHCSQTSYLPRGPIVYSHHKLALHCVCWINLVPSADLSDPVYISHSLNGISSASRRHFLCLILIAPKCMAINPMILTLPVQTPQLTFIEQSSFQVLRNSHLFVSGNRQPIHSN